MSRRNARAKRIMQQEDYPLIGYKPDDVSQRRYNKLLRIAELRGSTLCCFCGKNMTVKQMTIEHLMPKSKGGKNNKSNLYLAHSKCNSKAGNDEPSIKKKVMRRVTKQFKVIYE